MSNRNLKEFKPERYPLHDHGQGDLFADWFQNILRYVPERKCYYVYNKEQGIWEMDMLNLKAMEYSKELADALTVYLCSMEDSDKKKELQKVWGKWQFFRYRETILKEAKSVQPISLKEFDNKPSLFNCTNGTLDLETFDFREHDPHDFLTKVSGTEYNPESRCPMWESFISQSTEDNEEKSIYLQKALGYSLTGTAEHECFFILYGSTSRNGKGTCLRTMLEMMGAYGATANASTISKQDKQRSGSQPTEDIARLAGARFVNISEPDKGMELSSALIKTLTGQDWITARYLNENSFEYLPQFKLFIKRAFYRLLNMFTNKEKPEIMDMVKNIRRTNGEEGIELHNGAMIEFSARTRQASRGFDGISLIVMDEAQSLSEEALEAIVSTLSASATGIRQMIFTGTPPYPNTQDEVFRRFRKACIDAYDKGEITSSSWHEWSVPDGNLEKLDTSDKKLWYQVNPALGLRLTEEFTEEEFKTLDKAGFARERLGWWNIPPSENIEQAYVIDKEAWQACVSDYPKPDGKTAYGVKFTSDGSLVCLCGAVIPPHGKARISLIKIQPMGYGLNWLAEWLNERYSQASCVVIDGRNGAEVLVDKIADTWRFKGSIIRPSAMDLTSSVGLLLNEIAEHDVTWYRDQEILNDSALSSTKRKIGQGFGFGGVNSAPIEACALALWGAKTCKRDPSKKMKIG